MAVPTATTLYTLTNPVTIKTFKACSIIVWIVISRISGNQHTGVVYIRVKTLPDESFKFCKNDTYHITQDL